MNSLGMGAMPGYELNSSTTGSGTWWIFTFPVWPVTIAQCQYNACALTNSFHTPLENRISKDIRSFKFLMLMVWKKLWKLNFYFWNFESVSGEIWALSCNVTRILICIPILIPMTPIHFLYHFVPILPLIFRIQVDSIDFNLFIHWSKCQHTTGVMKWSPYAYLTRYTTRPVHGTNTVVHCHSECVTAFKKSALFLQ